ncbi:MAG: PEGA domain-containing protein [Bryobacteraceae bacterium]
MRFQVRNLAITAALALCAVQVAFSQYAAIDIGGGKTVQMWTRRAAVEVRDSEGRIVASIPIDKNPFAFAYSKRFNSVYVVHAAHKSERNLSIVNLTTKQVDKVIALNNADSVSLMFSRDGSRLYCHAYKGLVYQYRLAMPVPNMVSGVEADTAPVVAVIDLATKSVVSTYQWSDLLNASFPKTRYIVNRIYPTQDGERLLAAFQGHKQLGKPTGQRVAVFSGNSYHPVYMTDPGDMIEGVGVSQNEKILFAFTKGEGKHSESVTIIDTEKQTKSTQVLPNPLPDHTRLGPFLLGPAPANTASKQGVWVFTSTGVRYLTSSGELGDELALSPDKEKAAVLRSLDNAYFVMAVPAGKHQSSAVELVDFKNGAVIRHELNEDPRRIVRLGTGKGMWIMSEHEMRPLSESGELGDRRILLNKPRKVEEGDEEGASVFADGYPGETISLGPDRAAMMINNSAGVFRHRVALIDLKNFRIDSVVTTMTAGEKTGIITKRIALAVGLTVATGGNVVFVPNFNVSGGESLAATPGGRFLYALELATHEVTVVDVQAGTVLKRIPVNHGISIIQTSSDGKHLLCIPRLDLLSKEQVVQRIDFATNNLEDWKDTLAPGEENATQKMAGTEVTPAAAVPAAAPTSIVPPAAPVNAFVTIDSTPTGAEVEVDSVFVGNTPFRAAVTPGSHLITVKKKGFGDWRRKLNVTGGNIHLNAELDQEPAK